MDQRISGRLGGSCGPLFRHAVISKGQLHPKLHLPRLLRAEDAPEVRRAEDAVGDVEVRAVEQVEYLPARLELATAANAPRAGKRDVGGAEARADDAVPRCAAKGEWRGQGERRR